jgi:hypothetical protein
MTLPRYRDPLSLPLPPRSDPGITLAAARYVDPQRGSSIRVAGEVLCSQDDVEELEVPLLQAIALVALTELGRYSFTHHVCPVVGTHAVFADDVERRGPLLRAVFEVDLFEAGRRQPDPNRYWIHACCGPYVSAVIELEPASSLSAG